MRYLLNSFFEKSLRKEKLGESYVNNLLDDIVKGQGTSLGAGLYKIRGARKGQGKSGSYRNIFFWKKGERIIFTFLFPKGSMDNISTKELKALKILAKEYKELTDKEIDKAIKDGFFVEVEHEH